MNAARPRPDEIELVGCWKLKEEKLSADETANRIVVLLRDWFKSIAKSSSGWEQLLQDPEDGRYWELTYPMSEMQGGGPPMLKVISGDIVRNKYGIQF
jgi:hypothetical protein